MSNARAWGNASSVIHQMVRETLQNVERQMSSRSYRASNELRRASLVVLRGRGGGRRYRVPTTGVWHRASAPGSPPAVRTGVFRNSWGIRAQVGRSSGGFNAVARIESRLKVGKYVLGILLEEGAPRNNMAPRPYQQKVIDKALPRVTAIFTAPY